MKDVRLNIDINKPVKDVWDYILDSNNIPNWFCSIKEEIPSEIPTRLGTILRNRGDDKNKWSEYEVTELIKYKKYTLRLLGTIYSVTYTFTYKEDITELEYYEWVEDGELTDPATMEPLELLKKAVEKI